MNDIKSKVDFLNQISEGQDTDCLEEAMWRKRNAEWLKKSMDIANDVLDELHRQKMSKPDFAKAMGVTPQISRHLFSKTPPYTFPVPFPYLRRTCAVHAVS